MNVLVSNIDRKIYAVQETHHHSKDFPAQYHRKKKKINPRSAEDRNQGWYNKFVVKRKPVKHIETRYY